MEACWTSDPARIARECLADPNFLLQVENLTDLTVTPTGLRYLLPYAPFSALINMEPPVAGSQNWTGSVWFLHSPIEDRDLAILSLSVTAESEPPSGTFVLAPDQHWEPGNNVAYENSPSPEVIAFLHAFQMALRAARLQFDTQEIQQRTKEITFNGVSYSPRFEIAGTWYGYPYLFVYNGDTASLQVGGNPNTSSQGLVRVIRTAPLWDAEMEFGSPINVEGEFSEVITELFLRNKNSPEVPWLSSHEVTALFLTLASRLRRSDFSFFFKRIDTPELKEIRKNWRKNQNVGPPPMKAALARAHTLEEAREQLRNRYPYIEFEATPKEQDSRRYPMQDPPFSVSLGEDE